MRHNSHKHKMAGVAIDHENRDKNDFYATPLAGIMPLLRCEKFEGDVWEPACGEGAISEAFKAWGYGVVSTDLVHRGYGEGFNATGNGVDFLMQTKPRARNIVTNPPFSLLNEFIVKGLELNFGKLCLFARLQALESIDRGKIFKDNPPARIHVFSERITTYRTDYEGKGKGMMAFAWFCWDRGFAGKTTVDWI